MKRVDPWHAALRELGLSEASNWQEIQTHYRRLVLSLHPDLNRDDASSGERFRAVAAAYERLKSLKREREAATMEHLQAVAADPRLASLPAGELGMRLRYSASASVRATAAFLLGKIASAESRRLLLIACSDREEEVRRVAVDALARIGRPSDLVRCLTAAAARWDLLPLLARATVSAAGRRIKRHTGKSGPQASSFAWGR